MTFQEERDDQQQEQNTEENVSPDLSYSADNPDPASESIIYTVPEVSLHLRVDIDTVLEHIKSGELPAVYLGSAGYRISLADLKQFCQGRKEMVRGQAQDLSRRVAGERHAISQLYQWLRQEKEQMSECCRHLGKAVEGTISFLNQRLENARQNSHHPQIKAINKTLFTIFDKWSGPRFAYSEHIINSDQRWRDFCKKCSDDPKESKSLWSWLHQEGLLEEGPMVYGQQQYPHLSQDKNWQEKNLYQKMYLWQREEYDALTKHYLKMDKTIKKILEYLKSASKKSAKNMDFFESQAYNEAMLHLYEGWEQARTEYNNLSEGYEERWHDFRKQMRNQTESHEEDNR